uniref:Uncharacterized protein n=1 Tax=Rhizophora mucronata TaxID=61149 RepID=A0A2P2NHK1_RHIMU
MCHTVSCLYNNKNSTSKNRVIDH